MPLALVTGAGIRVGRAVALALAEAGYDLLLHVNRSVEPAAELAEEVRSMGREATVLRADLSDPRAIASLVDEVTKHSDTLDVLVNNAGIYESCAFEAIDPSKFETMLSLHVRAPFFLTQGLLPLLRKSSSASVINITDSDVERPYGGFAHYFTSKGALDMLTRVLAIELAPEIRVNAVGPGTVAVPVGMDADEAQGLIGGIPLRRFGDVGDIGQAVRFLVTSGTYMTGQSLRVDGGRST